MATTLAPKGRQSVVPPLQGWGYPTAFSRGSCVPSVASVSFVAERRFAPHPACSLGSPSGLLRKRCPRPRRRWRTPRKSRRALGMTRARCETVNGVLVVTSAVRETVNDAPERPAHAAKLCSESSSALPQSAKPCSESSSGVPQATGWQAFFNLLRQTDISVRLD